MPLRPFTRAASDRDPRFDPRRRPTAGPTPAGRSPLQSQARYRLYDANAIVHLEFRGTTVSLQHHTREARLLVTLLGTAGHFLSYQEARRELDFADDDRSQDALRQVKCRLNQFLRQLGSPLVSLSPDKTERNREWVVSQWGQGYLLNRAVKFVEHMPSDGHHVATGRRHDVGLWAVDQTKPDDQALHHFLNPYIAVPSTAWRRGHYARAQASPLLISLRSRPHRHG